MIAFGYDAVVQHKTEASSRRREHNTVSITSSFNGAGIQEEMTDKLKVAIVGGGPVGALSACFFAKRGFDVHLYECRAENRQHVQGRSINLSLATRGLAALQEVGLENILEHCVPVYGRMVHDKQGNQVARMYDTNNQGIYSVNRHQLSEQLLSAADEYANVEIHFNHKLVAFDIENNTMTFERQDPEEIVTENADLVVGADGAYSVVRRYLLKQPKSNYNQTYIEHCYIELYIPPLDTDERLMDKNYLHIWPREKFLMLALPNQNGSWTVSMFMPFHMFNTLTSPELLLAFFRQNFPDVIPLMGEQRLVENFFHSRPSLLVTVKCNPYHVNSTAVIIGDAAHTILPFYGQGVNAGFEDCRLLDEMLVQNNFNLAEALKQFSIQRNPDADAICDLATKNYDELSSLVNKRSFLVRKKLDHFLHWLAPKFWIPLYVSVTFTHMRYSDCIKNRQWQDKIIRRTLQTAGACIFLGAALVWSRWNHNSVQDLLKNSLRHVSAFLLTK